MTHREAVLRHRVVTWLLDQDGVVADRTVRGHMERIQAEAAADVSDTMRWRTRLFS